jgi:hypothetical protein
MVSHAAKKNENRRTKEKDPEGGSRDQNTWEVCICSCPHRTSPNEGATAAPLPLPPPPVSKYCSFQRLQRIFTTGANILRLIWHGSPVQPGWDSVGEVRPYKLASKRTPARSEGGQLLWTLPDQNSKEMLH